MDGIQGAILNVKLRYLPEWIEKRRKAASHYDDLLKDIGNVVTPYCPTEIRHVYHLYVVQTKKRDDLKKYLGDCGIATGIHYPIALPNLQAYRHLGYKPKDFPIASKYQDKILSFPMYPELGEEQIRFLADKVVEFLDQ